MAASHVALPEGVYVQNTFITVRPDYDHEPIRRTRSCPPSVRAEAPTRRVGCGQAVTVLIQNLPIRGRVSSPSRFSLFPQMLPSLFMTDQLSARGGSAHPKIPV